MKSLMSSTEAVVSKFVTYIEELSNQKGALDSKDICTRFTVENVVNTAFGLESHCFKPGQATYMEMIYKIFCSSAFANARLMMALFCPAIIKYLNIR